MEEFNEKKEFEIHIVAAEENTIGAIGLWKSIQKIIKKSKNEPIEYILICEDDHVFTSNYLASELYDCISKAQELNAELLSGGVSWFRDATHAKDKLFHVEVFSGLQFTILFRSIFDKILCAEFVEGDAVDYKICELAKSKYFIFPFISIQKDYGYSDVTSKNARKGAITDLFIKSAESVNALKKIQTFYKYEINDITCNSEDIENLSISTYIINLPERTDRRKHILAQFDGKSEFDITIIEGIKHEVGSLGLWLSIRKIIQKAIENDEDAIIICEDDHEFTKEYSKDYLFNNILEAHKQGVELLNGGIGGFGMSISVSKNRFWINWFHSTQFIVFYKSIFQKIIDEPFESSVTADGLLSELTSNKMVLYPFISIQKEFGYSDISTINDSQYGYVASLFRSAQHRLAANKNAFEVYNGLTK